MIMEETTVKYKNWNNEEVEFILNYEWIEQWGGGFEVEDILLGDVSVCDILSQKADDDICELAYEEAREQARGGYYD